MATLAEFLTEHGVEITEAEVVAALDELLGGSLRPGDRATLTTDEVAILRDHSGIPQPDPATVRASRARTLAAATDLVVQSLTTNQVAARLGVDSSRVRHWAAEGALYTLRLERQNRYPRWQFNAEGRPLPGLREVLEVLPRDLHPLEVEGFMTTPQPELELGDDILTAADWLAAGGDPAPVAALAAALDMPY